MPKFERAVIKALKTLPKGCWQRVDGLMTERVVLDLYPHWFPGVRLWLLEKRGLIEGNKLGHFWRSQRHLKSYRLAR